MKPDSATMRAMVLEQPRQPLRERMLARPEAGAGQVIVHVAACAVCRTDLHRVLWEERSIHGVANLTRRDGEEFFRLAPQVPIRTAVQTFPLREANEALDRLRSGQVRGAAVLCVDNADSPWS